MVTLFPVTTKKCGSFSLLGLIITIICSGMVSVPATARAGDTLRIEEARQCVRYFDIYEKKFAIPHYLLQAIALNESGRWHKEEKQRVPWPWTANVEGKGYYFNSKNEAIQNIKFQVMNGARSYDVGCMQVNMYYHGSAFRNLQQAFDPRYNVAYAASLLRQNYNRFKNWDKAVAAYHSQTSAKGTEYAARVRQIWHRLMRTAYYQPRPANIRKLAMNDAAFSEGYPVSYRKPEVIE